MQYQLDRFISRILFVPPPAEAETQNTDRAERAFNLALVFSGVRCILQYVVLPFVLPVVGIAGDFAVHISIVINVAAIIAIIYSLRRFWMVGYRHRWRYLPIALTALVLLVAFLVLDINAILNTQAT
jgi:ABC-type long-subunit fatty acid transport system fused permease/ATPase subunit